MGPKVGHQELEGIPGLSRKAGECCGPGLHNPLPLERPTTVNRCFYSSPLAKDHPFAGVSRFYGGVHHAQVAARSAYSPVHGVAVVDAEQVVAAATLGHVAVVSVSSGVEMVMAALGDQTCRAPRRRPARRAPGGFRWPRRAWSDIGSRLRSFGPEPCR